jgi:hypothetical protein
MAPCVGQASFKNSRIFPRPTTLTALTNAIVIAPGGNTVIPANINRTYLTIRNGSIAIPPIDDLFYSYPASPGVFLMLAREAVDIDSPQAVTVSNPGPNPVTLYTDEGSG